MTPETKTDTKNDILTVEVEDYYHVGAFHKNIRLGNWYRFEKRIEQNTHKALDLLDEFNIKATFFVLGCVADVLPEVVREVARRGHEVASKGYNHRPINHLTPSEFREEIARGRKALERVVGTRILGYRVAHRWLTPSDLWVLDVLAEEGYAYDSSVGLLLTRFATQPWRRFVHKHQRGNKCLWEFPLSSWRLGPWSLPIAGGNYYRQFPHTIVKRAVNHWHRNYDAPFVMYFHIWELDPDQPRIKTGSLLTNIRHYRNLNKMTWVLRDYFKKYRFTGIASYLGLDSNELSLSNTNSVARTMPRSVDVSDEIGVSADKECSNARVPGKKKDVSIVVPCYNEASNLKYLFNTLMSVQALLSKKYAVQFIFVDDHSSDETYGQLQQLFGWKPKCGIIRHQQNRGVAAAILTGIHYAKTGIVCSMDCDCSYDPHELEQMIPLLRDGVDLVSASPYHSQGKVLNVPFWRLILSRGASFLYKLVLRHSVATFTSCFRVYRREAVVKLNLREGGFLGIAEMLGLLILQGANVIEYPTTLEARLLGRSSMKILTTIFGHLRLLFFLLSLRLRRRHRPTGPGAPVHGLEEREVVRKMVSEKY